MGDQLTTVASFPAGFATLAGLIYAVVATPSAMWFNTCWSRMSCWTALGRVAHPAFSQKQMWEPTCAHQDEDIKRICHVLARMVTQKLRKITQSGEEVHEVEELIANLHFLLCPRKRWTEEPLTRDTDSRVGFELSLLTSETSQEVSEHLPPPDTPSVEQPPLKPKMEVAVGIQDYQRRSTRHNVLITPEKLRHRAEVALKYISANPGPLLQNVNFHDLMIASTQGKPLPKTIFAQKAAPWDVLITGIGLKGIEMLFSLASYLDPREAPDWV
jgi:hypothetical protein